MKTKRNFFIKKQQLTKAYENKRKYDIKKD
jgi:hypothetical protein